MQVASVGSDSEDLEVAVPIAREDDEPVLSGERGLRIAASTARDDDSEHAEQK